MGTRREPFLPRMRFIVTVDGVEHEVEPTPLAMEKWEDHYETDVFSLLFGRQSVSKVMRLIWLTLKHDGNRTEAIPAYEGWLARVETVFTLVPDDDDDESGDDGGDDDDDE